MAGNPLATRLAKSKNQMRVNQHPVVAFGARGHRSTIDSNLGFERAVRRAVGVEMKVINPGWARSRASYGPIPVRAILSRGRGTPLSKEIRAARGDGPNIALCIAIQRGSLNFQPGRRILKGVRLPFFIQSCPEC